jgi:hypothetical protein
LTYPNTEKLQTGVQAAVEQWDAGDPSALERCVELLLQAVDDLEQVQTIGNSNPEALRPCCAALLRLKLNVCDLETKCGLAAMMIRGDGDLPGSSTYTADGSAALAASSSGTGIEA